MLFEGLLLLSNWRCQSCLGSFDLVVIDWGAVLPYHGVMIKFVCQHQVVGKGNLDAESHTFRSRHILSSSLSKLWLCCSLVNWHGPLALLKLAILKKIEPGPANTNKSISLTWIDCLQFEDDSGVAARLDVGVKLAGAHENLVQIFVSEVLFRFMWTSEGGDIDSIGSQEAGEYNLELPDLPR